jgi:hypothetical protein
MNEIAERLGLINPVDFTRVFVNPDSVEDLKSRVSRMRGEFILIEGVRLKIVPHRNMPVGKVFFGGQVMELAQYEEPKDEKETPNAVHETECT